MIIVTNTGIYNINYIHNHNEIRTLKLNCGWNVSSVVFSHLASRPGIGLKSQSWTTLILKAEIQHLFSLKFRFMMWATDQWSCSNWLEVIFPFKTIASSKRFILSANICKSCFPEEVTVSCICLTGGHAPVILLTPYLTSSPALPNLKLCSNWLYWDFY